MSSIEDAMRDVLQADLAIVRLRAERQELQWCLLSEEQQRLWESIQDEYDTSIKGWEAELESAKEEVKTAVLVAGATQKVPGLQAQFVKGSEGWDGKKIEKLLDALIATGNEKIAGALEACRKPAGNPSVRFVFKEG